MKWFLIIGTVVVIVIVAILVYLNFYVSVPLPSKARFEVGDQLREFVPSLALHEEEFLGYPPALIGLANIFEHYGPSAMYFDRSEYLYRKALKLDPENKVAYVVMAKYIVNKFLAKRGRALEELKGMQQVAKLRNLQAPEVPSRSILYEWLREEGQEQVVIHDFNEARARICEKLDHTLPEVPSELEKGEQIEPDNALYNYLRAQLYFELGKDAEGITEIERGSNKPYLDNYWIEIDAFRKGVLLNAGFPEHDLEIIENSQIYFGGVPGYDKLMEIAKQQEASNNLKKAEQICGALIRLAEQVRQESVPREKSGKRGENEYSKRIEGEAKKQLAIIRSLTQDEGTQ